MSRRTIPLTASIFALALALSACSPGGASDGDSTAGASGDCSGTSVTGATPTEDSFVGTSAVAFSLEGGRAYTTYIGDFDFGVDDVGFAGPEIPADGTLFVVSVTVFDAPDVDALEPVAVGEVIPYTDESETLTIRVLASSGSGSTHGFSTDAEGTLAVTAVGDTFCGTVDYTDGEKSLSGTFQAPVKEG